MKKFTPHLVILIVGFLSLALMASNALAAKCKEKNEHLHQLSKKLIKKNIDEIDCVMCSCEKMDVLWVKHRLTASVLKDCDCDDTNDAECGYDHAHPDSGTGEWWYPGCIWGDPSTGIPDDSDFIATITRVVKYCEDNDSYPGWHWPRAGYHSGTWKLIDGITSAKLASGKIDGCDGVDPSYERYYSVVDDGQGGFELDSVRDAHRDLPSGQECNHTYGDRDRCDGNRCYLPGWVVGCISGNTTDDLFCQVCPPTGTYTYTEVQDLEECTDGCVTMKFPGFVNKKQICVVPTEKWKIKACYSGKYCINPDVDPCDQWGEDFGVRLEGVLAIPACR